MQIEWAIPCRYAERTGDWTVNALGVGEEFQAAAGAVRLSLVAKFTASVHEFGEIERIGLQILDPDMLLRDLQELELHPQEYSGRDEIRQPTLIAVLPAALEVRMGGVHALHLRLQGRLTTVPLFIRA